MESLLLLRINRTIFINLKYNVTICNIHLDRWVNPLRKFTLRTFY